MLLKDSKIVSTEESNNHTRVGLHIRNLSFNPKNTTKFFHHFLLYVHEARTLVILGQLSFLEETSRKISIFMAPSWGNIIIYMQIINSLAIVISRKAYSLLSLLFILLAPTESFRHFAFTNVEKSISFTSNIVKQKRNSK